MEILLNAVEARVLGALIEKELATPEYYPLTLNALVNACNQKSNREPVVAYGEQTVADALESLREKGLTRFVAGGTSRVVKYKHIFAEALQLQNEDVAILCVLMLRGPQTVGEVRGRTERLHSFPELSDVLRVLDKLIASQPKPLVMRLPRQPGQKDIRFMHLICGEPDLSELPQTDAKNQHNKMAADDIDRIAQLEKQVAELQDELHLLRQQFDTFKKQFE